MRIFLVVLFALLIAETITKPRPMKGMRHMKKGVTKIRSMKGMTGCCKAKHCARERCGPKPCRLKPRIRCKPSSRKPPTLDEIRQKLDDNGRKIDANGRKINDIVINDITVMHGDILTNGRKIDAILENVVDLKKNRSIDYYEDPYADDYEEYGSGLSSGNGPKDKSKLLSGKVDTLLEKMSDLKTTIDNAMEGKMRDANQNEDNPSTNQRIKPAKNLPHQENEEQGSSGSGSGDKE